MRFHITTEFAEREQVWRDAYAEHDRYAEAGDDGTAAGGTAEADAASQREYETLNALLRGPATTPVEVRRKLDVIDTRLEEVGRIDLEPEMEQIKRDMLALTRPNVSPLMASAFDVWRERELAMHGEVPDDNEQEVVDAATAAERTLYETPCTTPGDFIVKAYVNLLGTNESTGRFPFEVSVERTERAGPHTLDSIAANATLRDLKECDLGRCLLLLGRVDFDAEAWIAAADRVGHGFNIIVNEDGSRGLYQCCDGGEDRDMCMMLLAGGLEELSQDRVKAVIEEVVANFPDRVLRVPASAEAA